MTLTSSLFLNLKFFAKQSEWVQALSYLPKVILYYSPKGYNNQDLTLQQKGRGSNKYKKLVSSQCMNPFQEYLCFHKWYGSCKELPLDTKAVSPDNTSILHFQIHRMHRTIPLREIFSSAQQVQHPPLEQIMCQGLDLLLHLDLRREYPLVSTNNCVV